MSDITGLYQDNIGDSPQIDSYQRIRTIDPESIFGLYFSNGIHPLYFNTSTVGSGSVAFNANTASVRLSVSTGATDSIIYETKRQLRYIPGYSYQLIIAGVIGQAKTNVRQRLGYFGTNDGIFLEQTSSNLSIVMRTSTSGSPVDTPVTQGNWNLDTLRNSDGTAKNPSGINLDTSKYNAYVIDYVWQGAGRVRIGVICNNKIIYVHQFLNSNINTAPYWRTPARPFRIELTNTGSVGSSTTLDITCITALKESTADILAPYVFSASNQVTKITVAATALPVLSIRPKLTFNGITNRVQIKVSDFDFLSVQDIAFIRILINATLTGASFTSVNANSAVEFDTSATAVSGGTSIYETYVVGGGKGGSQILTDIGDQTYLGLDIAGAVQDTLTVTAVRVNASTDTLAAIRWEEFQ